MGSDEILDKGERFGRAFVAWEERVVGEREIVYLKGGEVVLRRPRCQARCRSRATGGEQCRRVGTEVYGFRCHKHQRSTGVVTLREGGA